MFLAVFLPALMGALATVMASLVWRAVLALGFGFVTYKGIGVALDALKNNITSTLGGASADMVGLLGYLWVDKALSVIFSAITVALSLKLVSGSVKKFVAK